MEENTNKKDNENQTINNDCFIIMPISDPEGYEKGHFKKIYEDIFMPACKEAGLNPIRADSSEESSVIHINILKRLLNSSMAICDLSSHNPNVMFELGIRQAFDMPTVIVQEEGTEPIFDINMIKYCVYHKNHLYREVREDQTNVAKFLKETQEALENGDIINSVVKLLSINKATIGDNPFSDPSKAYSYLASELSQLSSLVRQTAINQNFSNDDYYGKILLSLTELNEMIKSGVSKKIFTKNYNDLKSQIQEINDSAIRSILLDNLSAIKHEGDKFT